jgi:hypothetical protein
MNIFWRYIKDMDINLNTNRSLSLEDGLNLQEFEYSPYNLNLIPEDQESYQEHDLNLSEITIPDLTIQDSLLNDSRLSPGGNGSTTNRQVLTQPPTNGQKWWAAVIFGFIFGIISSPAAYYATSKITSKIGNTTTMEGPGPNFIGLLLHSIIFILIIRLVLW